MAVNAGGEAVAEMKESAVVSFSLRLPGRRLAGVQAVKRVATMKATINVTCNKYRVPFDEFCWSDFGGGVKVGFSMNAHFKSANSRRECNFLDFCSEDMYDEWGRDENSS